MLDQGIQTESDLRGNPELLSQVYQYILSEWTSDVELDIEKFSLFEKQEVARLQGALKLLPRQPVNLVKDEKEISAYIARLQRNVLAQMKGTISIEASKPFEIRLNIRIDMQHVSGYYQWSSMTFYYTVPTEGVALDDLEWLFLHEAIPGHHFQFSVDQDASARTLFSRRQVYLDYLEG